MNELEAPPGEDLPVELLGTRTPEPPKGRADPPPAKGLVARVWNWLKPPRLPAQDPWDAALSEEEWGIKRARGSTLLPDLIRGGVGFSAVAFGSVIPTGAVLFMGYTLTAQVLTLHLHHVPARVIIAVLVTKGIGASAMLSFGYAAMRIGMHMMEPLWWRLEARDAGVPTTLTDGLIDVAGKTVDAMRKKADDK